MKIGIYRMTCLVNGKNYIGKSKNLRSRIRQHKFRLRNGTHENPHLQNCFNKYGESKFEFEILEECNINELIDKEYFWINYYECTNSEKGFNIIYDSKREKNKTEVCNSETYRENMRILVNKRWEDPEYVQRNIESIQKAHEERKARGEILSILTPESKKKSRESCSTPEFLKGLSERGKKQLEDPEQRKIALKTLEEGRNNPLRLENLRKAKQDPEYKKMIAEKTRLSWIKRREKKVGE